jgi:hypothetical protein
MVFRPEFADQALIAMMTYAFGRVRAVIKMRIEGNCTQGRRGWVRLHEKRGRRREMSCDRNLEAYLDVHINAAGVAKHFKGYLLRRAKGKSGTLSGNPLAQSDGYKMFRRRAMTAGARRGSGIMRFRRLGSLNNCAMACSANSRSRWRRKSRR